MFETNFKLQVVGGAGKKKVLKSLKSQPKSSANSLHIGDLPEIIEERKNSITYENSIQWQAQLERSGRQNLGSQDSCEEIDLNTSPDVP